ncbi:MAG: hypothetical protein JO189_25590 [Deltaproteobacteria bacterium]|nr:hypothetical protein [Deltaproteobacteria bacterium]
MIECDGGGGGSGRPGPISLNLTSAQLQSKFKHASDFGINGNYSLENAARFAKALNDFVHSSDVIVLQGMFRGQPAIFYLDPKTRLNVIADRAGRFVTGFRLSTQQLDYVLKKASLGGGD